MSNLNAFDVVICGAGLAGLTLALQLRQANRTIQIAVLDRLAGPLPIAAHKVGEASTEIGSFYLAEILGLREYLDEVHYRKFGLRFFFHSSGVPFHQRPEIGLTKFIAPYAYNFDRGLLESDLRNRVAAGGVDLLEGCSIREIRIAGDIGSSHKIVYARPGEPNRVLEARWVVDAMGRRRFLQKQFNLTRPNRERYSAAWFRMAGRIDVSDFVSKTEKSWHDRVVDHSRFDATNHLCGPGYWVWIIRLSSNHTSIGLVADEEVHPFNSYNSYPKLYRWLQRHEPELAHHLGDRKPKDFKKMPRYSYSAKQIFSSNRWACVGEAATFTDPLYGTGTDMIGLANCLTTQLIEKDLLNGLDAEAVDQANLFFLSFNDGLADNIMTAYSCFGHSLSMAMKTIWDTMAGWAFTAPMLFNSLYVDTQFRQRLWPHAGKFFLLAHRVQQLFQDWAASSVSRGHFEFIDYLALPFVRELRLRNLQSGQTDEELLAAHRKNIESFELFAQVIFLLALEDTVPHKLRQLPSVLWLNAWGISLDESRWRQDRLFSPDTEPRDLQPMWDLLRSHIFFSAAPNSQTGALPAIVEAPPITEKYGAPDTLPAALQRAAAGNRGVVYLQTNGPDIDQSYRELLEDASSICAGLQAHGKKPDDIVILQLPLNQDFIPALWGCLLGGFIAAPVSVPTDYTKSAAANRFHAAWDSLDKPLILSSIALAGRFGTASTGSIDKGRWVSVEELRSHPPDYESVASDPDQLAILLLTSGSTGVPKAVQLRHSSILTRAEGRKRHFSFSDQDVSLNWFPLDHVASLVMFHLRDVYLGCKQIHAPTRLALENPLRWLDWLSEYNATLTWAPNFAYALVNEREEEIRRGDWDLSNLRCLLNGGEPIDSNTVATFLHQLSKHGLRDDVMYPDWGMTEIASGVVCPDPVDPAAIKDNEFCLGRPIPGTAFRITDDRDRIIREREIGRVQVKGSTVTAGYFGDPRRSTELISADGWLDTGDLGFLDQGKLTITGREKEVIIINGVNFSCGEIEEIVERLDCVRVAYTAACAIRQQDSQTDLLAIFFCSQHHQHAPLSKQMGAIREGITKAFGITPSYVVPLFPPEIPKSSIGKIQRATLLKQLASGVFDKILEKFSNAPSPSPETPATKIEQQIMDIWAQAFDTASPGLHGNFFDLGGHSLIAVQIMMRLQESFGIEISIGDLFDAPTVRLLAERISSRSPQSTTVQHQVKGVS